jgi:fibronectin-binding autotransporter adhesin
MQTRRAVFLCANAKLSTFTRLVLLAIALLACCQTSQGALIGYWDFDQGSGLIARDVSGNVNNHDGTLQGGTRTPTWIPGRLGTALDFTWNAPNATGDGDLVIVPFHDELRLNGPFTISYWYRMDAPNPIPGSTFPGIMRIGSQSATTGSDIGWGFFRTVNMVFKRGNVQPAVTPTIPLGQWHHLSLTYNGSNSTVASFNGTPFVTNTTTWLTATTTRNFEMGTMDQYDDAALDELALWNEPVSPAKIRSIYTVPTSLGIDYNLADLRTLWGVFDGAGTSNATVKGSSWSYASSLPGSTTLGNAYISGGSMYVVLGAGTGVSAPITIITGTFSPSGIGTPGTISLVGMPAILVTNANLHFDLDQDTTVGGGINDLIDVAGDLTFVNSTISIGPLGSLPAGTYRLFNYTGTKTGSPTVLNSTRYSLALDESTAGQINLIVSGVAGGPLRWISQSSGAWDLTTSNWFNQPAGVIDRFFQGDAVFFDGAAPYQTNITINGPVFTDEILVDSHLNYSFTGTGQIAGNNDGLTKQGTGILILGTANTFVGDVNVNAGTLRLGNSAGLGTTNGGTIIAPGATLDLAGNAAGTEPIDVQGGGIGGLGAIINSGAALSNNGLRGRVTLTGDTTFGGVNRWDVIGGTLVGNGYRLTKVGAPEIALSDLGETSLGPIDILQGILTILGTTRAGDVTQPITVNTNAILALWDTRVILNKPVVMNQAIMRNNTSGGANISTNLGAVTLNGDATFQATANIALLGVVSGAGNLIKVNTGTLYLGGVNTYSGRTTISAGRLALLDGGSINNSPRIELPSGAILDVTRLTTPFAVSSGQLLVGSGVVAGPLAVPAGGTVLPGTENVPGTLTLSNGLSLEGGALTYDIAAAITEGAGVNDLINITGDLNLTGATTINLNPLGVLTIGNTYTLINYSGTLTGTEANLAVATTSRYTFSISLATAGKVTVTVMGGAAASLFWLGGALGAENLWDLQTSINWSDSLGNPETFFGGDNVLFDDFAVTNIIDLVGALTPASIIVENGSVDYVFQGSGKLSGNSTLTKRFVNKLTIANTSVNDSVGPVTVEAGTLEVGNGATSGNLGSGSISISNGASVVFNRSDTLTLANRLFGDGNLVKPNNNLIVIPGSNSNYNGTVSINGGTLRPGHSNALGSATGGTVLAAGATLDVNAIHLGAEPVTVAGAGVGNNGAIINSAGGQNNALRFVTLAGHTTFGGSGRWDIRSVGGAALNTGGNSYNLTKVGANQVSLVDVAVDPALGDINVMAGTFSAEAGTGAGDPTKTITVASGATLFFFGRTVLWDKIHVFNGGSTLNNNNGASVVSGPVTLNGTVTFNVAGTSLTINSNIIGPGALTKIGGSPLILLADNTYPGATTVNAGSGSLQFGNGTNAGWVAGNLVMNNNTLTVYRSDTVTVSNTLTGTGTLNVRTPQGLVIGNNTVNFGTINIGLTTPGRLILQPGFTGNIGALSAGENPGNSFGDLYQLGGTLNISGLCRVGHWPNETSTYIMGGGALTLTGVPTIVPNVNTNNEQAGIVYLGVDGVGILVQTGGVVRAHGVVFDARGNSPGTDTYTLTGGEIILGPSGFKSGSFDANTSYAINLGGGKITSSANWNSVLRMDLNGVNGNVTFDTAGFSNVLSGPLTGVGGLTKTGSGTLVLTGNATYEGPTTINIGGTLLVRGSLGIGSGSVTLGPGAAAGATLAGDGTVNDPVTVLEGGRVAPGSAVPSPAPSIGKLTINNTLTLQGTSASADMDISKNGSTLTNDLIAVSGALNYDGRLTVRASGDPLANGDVFNLFDAASFNGSFDSFTLPTLPSGLYWDTSKLAVDGTIRITGPQLAFSRAGNMLSLSWPAGNLLQVQTNAPGIGLNENWMTVDTVGNSANVIINPNLGSVFFRLISP